MSEEIKKVEQTGPEAPAAELSEHDLDNVSGGAITGPPPSPCPPRGPVWPPPSI
jgi:bacteriocin-like protein